MEVFLMPDVLIDRPDEHHSAFVDPWSHQPQHQGDIPAHALFAGAWHLDVGVDVLHEALFLVGDEHADRLWSLITPSEKCTLESLGSRERGDRGWANTMITCGCVAGAPRHAIPDEAARILIDRLLRARIHFSGPRPPYISGLLTSQEVASMVEIIGDELRSNAIAAEAAIVDHEASIINVARDLGLNPRPAGHNSTAWISNCAHRSHFIMISPSDNKFGCGYCKRAGGPAELRAFCEGINDRKAT
jgi:hypothetical protein